MLPALRAALTAASRRALLSPMLAAVLLLDPCMLPQATFLKASLQSRDLTEGHSSGGCTKQQKQKDRG